jgi:hypothetical protein
MTLRSAHEDCIKWIAVHPTKSEGYTLWWNGGTIREMMKDEAQYNRESIYIILQAAFLIDSNDDYQKKLDAARHVEVFRMKRHKLAWTFLNTMNNVHHCHTLYNDMSPDNVILYFPPNSAYKVYIGICDWAMAGNFNDLKESLYSGNLSLEYYNKQHKEERGDDTFSFLAMDQTFQRSLEQLYKDDPKQRATLNWIVNRFMNIPFNWPVPNVGNMLRSYTKA